MSNKLPCKNPKIATNSYDNKGKQEQIEIQYKCNGNLRTLQVQLDFCTWQVKNLIQLRDEIPVLDQVLSFQGKRLVDGRSLAEYNVQKGSRIDLLLPLDGGASKRGAEVAEINCATGGGGIAVPVPAGLVMGPVVPSESFCAAHTGGQEDSQHSHSTLSTPNFLASSSIAPQTATSSAASAAQTVQDASGMDVEVATSNWIQLEWQNALESLVISATGSMQVGQNWPLAEIHNYARAVETLQYYGLDPENDDPWRAVGLTREFAPAADVLEGRRRTLRMFFSSFEGREDWSLPDQLNRDAGFKKLELALNTCQTELPAILKKLKKQNGRCDCCAGLAGALDTAPRACCNDVPLLHSLEPLQPPKSGFGGAF